jgi:sigma-B regulation protein RsbU (phosphoserine phosphatase)
VPRPAWSIRTKFLAVIVLLLLASMTAYLVLAVRLFEDDKTAYIHDGSASLAAAAATETETLLGNVVRTLQGVALALGPERKADAGQEREIVRALLDADADIVELLLYRNPTEAPDVRYVKSSFLEDAGLDAGYLERLAKARPLPVEAVAAKGFLLLDASLPDGAPLLTLGIANGNILTVARVRHDRIVRILTKSEIYTSYLLDGAGQPLVGARGTEAVVRRVLESTARVGTLELFEGEKGVIAAYAKLGLGDLAIVAEIPRDKAFLASRKLVRRSVQFAALIVLFSLTTSAIFTKRLTTSIDRLFQATRKIGSGDFNVKVDARSNDEIGALATSFNRMTGEIINLMGQVADKARMEKELETARVVQENLFPAPSLQFKGIELASFYMPASECGGDWCGYLTVGDQVIVLLGDATGHGVPAALITAAAQSCCMTLYRAGMRKGRFHLSAGQVMEYLNFAVYNAAHGKVKMTFFVAIIDSRSGTMRFANASHEMPLLLRKRTGKREILGIDPGPCLGESPTSSYTQDETRLEPGDVLVCYTDGLLECKDATDDEWGERRFLKSLDQAITLSATGIKDKVVADALAFCKDGTRDDDVTCIIARMGAAS